MKRFDIMIGDILLPPSPNWFIGDAIDSRSEDGLLVTAAFKTIVVYLVTAEERLPKILKIIPYNNEKVLSLRLHRRVSDPDYGHTVACIGDTSSVRLCSLHTGDVIAQHQEHQGLSVNSICWSRVGGEEVIVTVGGSGRVVVWQARHEITRVFTLHQFADLSLVESNPVTPAQALVAAEKDIMLISLKDGGVLSHLQGHDFGVYCMRWYVSEGNPISPNSIDNKTKALKEGNDKHFDQLEEKSVKGSERDNWRSKTSKASDGPFFVSSDYGRNILLWDLSARRYISKVTVPHLASGHRKQISGKDKIQGKQHIALAWHNGELLSSSIRGELLQWTFWPGGSISKLLHHLHNRAIYNLVVIGDVAVTSGQDRFLHGFHLVNSTHLFQLSTLGACATTLSFCPQDVKRLAIGSQENNIRLLNLGGKLPLHTQVVWQNIKGKILSLSWHPAHEGRLLFGTGSGQVGWTDVSSGRVTTFAYYHQKAVYKVEWAPSVCPQRTGLLNVWCAYSFGDREIVIRTSSDPMADPICLQTLIPESENRKAPKDITEFSFSHDYKYIAVGSQDGQVRVYRSSDMELMVTLAVVRKAVQHLLWQPPTDTCLSYILAVGSNESKIYIFHLEKFFNGKSTVNVITQATQELCSHESRVVWLAWSPHKDEILASASYDHTVQLWDTKTGKPLVNYGGHTSRVFRVEFSPDDPDLLYSFADENSVHAWRPSQLTCKTSSESNAILKDYRPRKVKEREHAVVADEDSAKSQEDSGTNEKKSSSTSSTNGSNVVLGNSGASSKKAVFKSFFPKLHAVCSRKKSFHHMVILNLLAQNKAEGKSCLHKTKECKQEDAEEELEEESVMKEEDQDDVLLSIDDTSEKYRCLLEKDSEMASPEDFLHALNMYGNPQQMDSLLTSEIDHHEARGNLGQASLMHCWRGSLDDHIRFAARHKKLTPFLVASAPQVSMKLWELASEVYAEQLVEEGDVITGASYLINTGKVEEAIDVLLKYRHFREAIAIAKCRLGYNEEMVDKVVTTWAASAIYEGSFDLAAALQLSIGQLEDAARTLARRSDPGSLFLSAKLYEQSQNPSLANSVGLLALKEACLRHDHIKIEPFLSHLPKLIWFQAISCCHCVVLSLLQQVTNGKGFKNYLLRSRKDLMNQANQENDIEKYISGTNIAKDEDNIKGSSGEKMIIAYAKNGHDSSLWIPLLERVKEEWLVHGITQEKFPQLYETVTHNFSTQQMPTSVKQLWFLVSVALSECLLSTSLGAWEQHLTSALNYALYWGKHDQLLHLTHALLPRGVHDLTSLGASMEGQESRDLPSSIRQLCWLYYTAELSILHSFLQSDESWSVLQYYSSANKIDEVEEIRPIQDKLLACGTVPLPFQSVVTDQDFIETEFSHIRLSSNQSEIGNIEQPERSEQGEESKDLKHSETAEQRKAYDKNFNQAEIAEQGMAHDEEGTRPKRKEYKEVHQQPESTRHGKTCKDIKEPKTTEEDQEYKEFLKMSNTVEPGKGFRLPQSKNELIAFLHFYLDSIETNSATVEDVLGPSSGWCSPSLLLQEIILKVRERGDFKEDDVKALQSKVSFHDTKSQ